MITRDPDYVLMKPVLTEVPSQSTQPKGVQCGECGMTFLYGTSVGYCCGNARCPCGYASFASKDWVDPASIEGER